MSSPSNEDLKFIAVMRTPDSQQVVQRPLLLNTDDEYTGTDNVERWKDLFINRSHYSAHRRTDNGGRGDGLFGRVMRQYPDVVHLPVYLLL